MPINIYELTDAFRTIENDFEERRYVDKKEGKICEFCCFDEEFGSSEKTEEPDNENLVPFPGKYEFRAYDVMEDFANLQKDIGICSQLMHEIGGKGTFGRFRRALERLHLLREWYDYEDKAWIDFTIRWCRTNDIDFEPKPQEFVYVSAKLEEAELVTDLLCKLYYKSKRKIKEHYPKQLEENRILLTLDTQAMFIAYDGEEAIGIAHVSQRSEYVEGTEKKPVGYLEAVFVEQDYRRKDIGRNLVYECEKWACRKGCSEFASDCELDNIDSYRFHISVGLEEVSRNIHFKKDLQRITFD